MDEQIFHPAVSVFLMNATEHGRTVWATYLLLALPFVSVLSTTLTGLLEVVLYLLFLITPELRKRFVDSLSQPMVIFGLCLYFVIIVLSLWSPTDWESRLRAIKHWRKILLLPMAVSLINSNVWKDRFLLMFIFLVTAVAFLSWVSWISDIAIYKPAEEMLGTDATQGMTFFVAAFASACMVAYHKGLSLNIKRILMLCFLVIVSNSVIIATSRSGYLLGIVLVCCFSLYAGGKKSIFVTPLLVAITAGIFYLSPVPHSGITEGWNNMMNVEHASENTSMGLRVVHWKNTLPIIKKSPIIGHGVNGFAVEYAKQVAGVEGWKGTVMGSPHNQYLYLLAEYGILGLAALLAFIFACFFQRPEPLYRFLGLSILLGWMATSFFNNHFSVTSEGRLIFLWCAAMLSMPLASRVSSILPQPHHCRRI